MGGGVCEDCDKDVYEQEELVTPFSSSYLRGSVEREQVVRTIKR